MKSIIYITVLFFSLGIFAQKPIAPKQKVNFTPEQRAELQSKRLALVLDLNDKQLKQVTSLQLERAKLQSVRMEARKQKMISGEKPTQDEIFTIKSRNLDEQLAFQKQMKEILTDEQYKKWKEVRKNRFEKKQKRNVFKRMHTGNATRKS